VPRVARLQAPRRVPGLVTLASPPLLEAGLDGGTITLLEADVKLKVVLEPSDEGGYTVYIPSLPGCISEGDSLEDAMKNIREAIELYLEQVDDELAGREGLEIRELVV